MLESHKKTIQLRKVRVSQERATLTAYPTKSKPISGNVDTVHIDTVEKTLRLSDDNRETNRSVSFEYLS